MAVLIRNAGSVPVVSPIFPSASNCSSVRRMPNAFDFLAIVTLGYLLLHILIFYGPVWIFADRINFYITLRTVVANKYLNKSKKKRLFNSLSGSVLT